MTTQVVRMMSSRNSSAVEFCISSVAASRSKINRCRIRPDMPRGRRPGPSGTREALIEAARARFAESGYDGVSLRSIATDVGVDPALAIHFFGSKEKLFREALGWPFDPSEVALRVIGSADGLVGDRLARVFLGLWEDPATGRPLQALIRSAMTHEQAARLLREFLEGLLFRRLAQGLQGPDRDLRINLAASQLIGVAILRHVLVIEPLASAGIDDLVARLAPALNSHLGVVDTGALRSVLAERTTT
jgi:AcrR family transcriptional regulator